MRIKIILLCLVCLLLAACQAEISPTCEAGNLTYQSRETPFPVLASTPATSEIISMEINGKIIQFDQVIHGPLCNQNLSGTIYVACDVQIYKWEETQNFLDDCDFKVADGTVIYVAAHNNTAYFNGCAACHVSGSEDQP
jgi:hypothetical protein